MIAVLRRPGGGWEEDTGRRLWYNRGGQRTLTQYGAQCLQNFQGLMVHVPAIESGFPTPDHPTTQTREVFYPVSENSLPGMLAMLQATVPAAYRNRLEDLTVLPPLFRNWVIEQLDPDNTGILDESSDRYWEPDPSRPWYMSVQHVEVRNGRAQLVTDLADRPMQATQWLYHDIPCLWHLSPVASTAKACVPLSLCEALGTNFA